MFGKFSNRFFRSFRTYLTKIATGTALIGCSLYFTSFKMADDLEENQNVLEKNQFTKNLEKLIKQLENLKICSSQELPEGVKKMVKVKDFENKQHKILVLRAKDKVYAISGQCPHREPFDEVDKQYSLQNAVVFNDKLYCPHHGCVYDVKSGSIEHGPSLLNLAIFFVQQKATNINLIYPKAIPRGVQPIILSRDPEDLRKVVIIGGDENATIGCINGLRQFDFTGQLTVLKEGLQANPIKKQYLHKSFLNLRLRQKKKEQKSTKQLDNTDKTNKIAETDNITKKQTKKSNTELLEERVASQTERLIYDHLQYYPSTWYQEHGIDFIYTDEPYRVINKRFYPYLSFNDGTKLEFDGLLIAPGLVYKIPSYQGITVIQDKDSKIKLAENVFCPFRSRTEHLRLMKFLNLNQIKSLLVVGFNLQSLQFIQSIKKQFPQIKVKVVDDEKHLKISSVFGKHIQSVITQEFTSRDVEIYTKIQQKLLFSNKFAISKKKQNILRKITLGENFTDKYKNSIKVRVADDLRLQADGVVIFNCSYGGNTDYVKNGKYTDFDFLAGGRLGGDLYCRTDNLRIFSAGSSSANDYYLLTHKLVSINPLVAFEQGFNAALNMQALRIPFTYVPVEYYNFFGKKLIYTGTREFYDSMLVIGSVEDWDFLNIYALQNKIVGVCGSESKSKEINIFREAYRVNCIPNFQDLITGYWTVQNLQKLINKLGKSGCYRDLIYKHQENVHHKDTIWMERTPGAGFENDHPEAEDFPTQEIDSSGKIKQL